MQVMALERASADISCKVARAPVVRFDGQGVSRLMDRVAVEAALEMRLAAAGHDPEIVAVTMRTPGDDAALVLGFLFAEGLIGGMGDVLHVRADVRLSDVVTATLQPERYPARDRLARRFPVSSSCGVCGKASLEALRMPAGASRVAADFTVDASLIHALPQLLRSAQSVFNQTGGVHAAALVSPAGVSEAVREDVGRHNAVDKVIGCQIMKQRPAPMASVLVVSGRVSFEIVQKAVMAGLPVIVAVGAPTSLAVELAERYSVSLIGFAGPNRFNVYTETDRLR